MVFVDGFIKKDKLHILDEHFRATDLLGLSKNVNNFIEKIDALEGTFVLGLIGKLGSGKTTFINQFMQNIEEKCFEFEARKYPGRKDLRENLILEIARQIDPTAFDNALDIIEGKQNKDKKKLLEVVGSIPSLGAIKHFDYFLETSPATRTFQLWEILKQLLCTIEGDKIYIILEDIDRAGKEGIFFLETLNYYIKSNNIGKDIVVIALIGEENYEIQENKLSFQKYLDIKESFLIEEPSFRKFVDQIFIQDILDNKNHSGQIVSFLEGIFIEYGEFANMRMIKSIIREANMRYKVLANSQGEGIDRRLSILFEASKHIDISGEGVILFDEIKEKNEIVRLDNIFGGLVACICAEMPKTSDTLRSSIYKEEFTNSGTVKKIIKKRYRGSVKIVKDTYENNQVKDSIWYFTHHMSSEGKNNYFGITELYGNSQIYAIGFFIQTKQVNG